MSEWIEGSRDAADEGERMKGTKYDGRKMAANKISIELIQLQSLSRPATRFT